ncbi:hypothetical protein Tco_1562582 [Tanacetum coccineum]
MLAPSGGGLILYQAYGDLYAMTDGEVLNELIEYENVGMLCCERAINSFDEDDLAFQYIPSTSDAALIGLSIKSKVVGSSLARCKPTSSDKNHYPHVRSAVVPMKLGSRDAVESEEEFEEETEDEIKEEEEDSLKHFDTFPAIKELSTTEYEDHEMTVESEEEFEEETEYEIKEEGRKLHNNWIMSKRLGPRRKPSNPGKICNFMGRVKGLKLEQQQDNMITKINILWKAISEKLDDAPIRDTEGNPAAQMTFTSTNDPIR